MKAKITAKSELRLSDLTREYTFDIINGEEVVLASQVQTARPSEIVTVLQQKVAEYWAAYEDENDLQIGSEV
jgi:hypothetical protein